MILIWFLLWPALAGVAAFVDCWKYEGMRLRTSGLIGLGIAAGALAVGLAVVAW